MAICKRPKHKGGKRPPLGRLNAYLAKEEKREAVLFLDGQGHEIDASEATKNAGGYNAEHWHGIIAPSHLECSALIERYGDPKTAAIEHGKALSVRLQTSLKSDRPPNCAIHFEHDKDGHLRFHYHFVGSGKANGRLFGESGKLSQAWERETNHDRKPITNWHENRLYLETKKELQALQREQRQLSQDRQKALKAVKTPWEKLVVRDRFTTFEIGLVNRRHTLEIKSVNHRYASRNDSMSTAHQIELAKIDSRKASSLARIANRGQNSKTIERMGFATGKGISSAKRGATKGLAAIAITARKLHQDLKAASENSRPHDPTRAKVEIPGAEYAKSAALSLLGGAAAITAEAGQASAKAVAKAALYTGKASLKMAVGLVVALPTGGASLAQASQEAGKDLGEGAKAAGQELGTGLKNMASETARSGVNAGKTLGSAGLGALPPPVQETIRGGIAAGKATVHTLKDALTMDLPGATSNAILGGFETAKHAAGAVMEGAKALPPIVKLPLKVVEMIPLIGLAAKTTRLAIEVAMTTAPAVTKAIEFER